MGKLLRNSIIFYLLFCICYFTNAQDRYNLISQQSNTDIGFYVNKIDNTIFFTDRFTFIDSSAIVSDRISQINEFDEVIHKDTISSAYSIYLYESKVVDNNIFFLSSNDDGTSTNKYRTYIYKYNIDFNLIDSLSFKYPGEVIYTSLTNKNNNLFLAGSGFYFRENSIDLGNAAMVKVDLNTFDTVFTKVYGGGLPDGFYGVYTDELEPYLYLYGYSFSFNNFISSAGPFSDGWIVKVDTNGNELWRKSYDVHEGKDRDEIIDMARSPDGSLILVSHRSYGEDINVDNSIVLYRIDTAGNVLHVKAFWDTLDINNNRDWIAGIKAIAMNDDGTFVAAGNYYRAFTTRDAEPFLIKFDADFNVIWRKEYGDTGEQNFTDIIKTNDGGYAMSGAWGSIGAVGSPGYVPIDAWYVRTDSNGCISESCINSIENTHNNSNKNTLLLYPNPVDDILTIQSMNEGNLIFYNQLGEQVKEQSIHYGSNYIKLNNLSSGIYYYNLNNGEINGKIIKN